MLEGKKKKKGKRHSRSANVSCTQRVTPGNEGANRRGQLSTAEMQKFDLCVGTLPRAMLRYEHMWTVTARIHAYTPKYARLYIYILYIYTYIYMWYNRTGIYVCIDLACISRDEARTMMHGRSTAHLPFPLSPIHAFFSLTRLLSMFHRSRDTKGKSAPEFQTRYSAEPTVIVYARARALTIN